MAEEVRQGEAAEGTELGQVVREVLDFFERMDLPTNLDDMRIVIVAETEKEGVCAGSSYYGDSAQLVAADLMQHASVLLGTLGVGMEIMTADELSALMNPKDKT